MSFLTEVLSAEPLLDKMKIRLNKFISNSGICSRREADKFIKAGVVSVNGFGVTEMGYKVGPHDIVKFNNQKICSENLRYVVLNKPKNCSTRVNAKMQKNSVISLVLSSYKEKIYPIDNLNTTETGLLLFTNDDALAKKIRNRNQKIQSVYQVTLDKKLSQIDLEKIRNGISFNGKKYTFDSISYIKQKEKNEIGIEHSKGGIKYIKDIFKKLNYCIQKLDRVAIGGVTKKNLPRKHYRNLSKQEINILKRL